MPTAATPPKRPAGQGRHTPPPASLYSPAAHGSASGAREPGGHANPAVQFRVHAVVALAGEYRPTGHGPEHRSVVSTAAGAPKRPGGQGKHPDSAWPAALYVPAGHWVISGEPALA